MTEMTDFVLLRHLNNKRLGERHIGVEIVLGSYFGTADGIQLQHTTVQ
jgi:hypothetical protein